MYVANLLSRKLSMRKAYLKVLQAHQRPLWKLLKRDFWLFRSIILMGYQKILFHIIYNFVRFNMLCNELEIFSDIFMLISVMINITLLTHMSSFIFISLLLLFVNPSFNKGALSSIYKRYINALIIIIIKGVVG